MARLLADENFPFPAVQELRRLGHDVATLAELGHANCASPDEVALATARDDARALVTHNRRHFIRMHDANSDHAGIVACTVDPDFVGLAARINTAISSLPSLNGKLIRVNRGLSSG